MEEKKKNFSHSVFLEQRERGKITGVSDVRSFDEKLIVLASGSGVITIKGENLHVEQLNLEHGQVELTGKSTALCIRRRKHWGKKASLYCQDFSSSSL